MCVTCPEHDDASGVDVVGVATTLLVLAVAGLAYRVFTVIWPLYLVALVLGWTWTFVPRRTRKRLWRKLRRAIRRAVRRRRKRRAASTFVAQLYLTRDGRTQMLSSGPVPGQWDSAETVQAEIVRLYVDRYGLPPGAQLACTAEPVKRS